VPSEEENEGWRGRVGRLEQEEVDAFLAQGQIARLACLDADGWPYVVPVWQEWDGTGFWVIPRMRSAWASHLKANPRCAITVDESGTLRKVIAQGEAKLVEEPNVGGRWVEIAERMSIRYLGENGPKYLAPTLDKKRWLFYIRPVRLWTWQGVDWARRYKVD
jgi:nitroimidazol reductase NimA-like FMN-containing flavoprotein (pyridoxamine 5'-phosphate oxidase superfamily)